MSYTFSYSPDTGVNPPKTPDNPEDPLYAVGDVQFFPINSSTTLLLNRSNGEQQFVSADVARSVAQCARFASVSTHVANIVAAMPALAGQREMVRDTLQQLAEAEFLISAGARCAEFNRPLPAEGRPRTRIFIITADRPGSIEKLLDSMANMQGLSGHERLFLIDSSRHEKNVQENATHVEYFNTRSAQSISHITPQVQAAFCAALAERMPQHRDAISFLLDRTRYPKLPNYGAARNICLLLSCGRRAVVLDDDILAFRLRSPEADEGLQIAAGVDSEVRFYPSMEAVLGNIDALEESAVDAIGDCLGLPLSSLPSTLGMEGFSSEHLRGTPGIIAGTLHAESPVLVTQCGTLGDPGTEGLGWMLLLNDASRDSLLQTLKTTGGDRLERCCWRGARRTTVAKMASMSQLTGLDNSHLLPPYFPYFRGEDLTFGAALDFLHPHAAIVEHNWSIAHLPQQYRGPLDLASGAVRGAGSLGLVARRISDAVDPRSDATAQQRLQELATMLEREVARGDHDLAMEYREATMQTTIEQLNLAFDKLQQLSTGDDTPWKAFLERSVEEIRGALLNPPRPGDLVGEANPAGDNRALAGMREMMSGYAAGLRAWPELREHAEAALAAISK